MKAYKPVCDLIMQEKNGAVELEITGNDPHMIPEKCIRNIAVFSFSWEYLGWSLLCALVFFLLCDFILRNWELERRILRAIYRATNYCLLNAKRIYCLWTILFVIVVVCGLTGSSLGNLRWNSHGLIQMNDVRLFGSERMIRSDEWMLRTPFAIGNLREGCPVISRNFSPGGRNNLLRFYTGVPVKHISSLAHPQTWGLMFLPLRQGLSWYWFFPIFASIAGIFAFLNLLFPDQCRNNFLLALTAGFAPCMAFWSFWPLLICGYSSASAAFFLLFLRALPEKGAQITRSAIGYILLWSLLFGWSSAATALLLMAPRLVPCATLVGLVVIAHIIEGKLVRKFSGFALLMLVPGIVVLLLILGVWYWDAREVIAAIAATVYPGKRFHPGGGYGMWYVFGSGWWNFYSGYYENGDVLNICERISYFSLLLPFFVLFICNFKFYAGDWKLWAILGFMFFALTYQIIGFPEFFARITAWGKSHNERVNCAMAYAQILMLAALLKRKGPGLSVPQSLLVGTGALFFTACIFVSGPLRHLQLVKLKAATPEQLRMLGYAAAIAVIVWITNIMFCNNIRWFIRWFMILNLGASFAFNPLVIAPSKISHIFKREIASVPVSQKKHRGRILTVLPDANVAAASGLYAAGESVWGAYFFYPDPVIYKLWFAGRPDASAFNQKGHVIVRVGNVKGDFSVRRDAINLTIMYVTLSRNYDFSRLPVDFVLFSPDTMRPAADNRSLELISSKCNFALYRVCRNSPLSTPNKE